MVKRRVLLVVAAVSLVVSVLICLSGCAAVQYQRVDAGADAEVRQMERDSLPLSPALKASAAAGAAAVSVPVGK